MMGKRGFAAAAVLFCVCAGAQNALAQRNRIAAIDRSRTVTLSGHVHPLASAANDRGQADAAMPMEGMTLLVAPSAAQQADLDALLERQQDPASPDFPHWLTPEDYANRFGLSTADLTGIRTWLEGEGFNVISVARGRNSMVFSGTAGQVERAFHTQIHRYMAEGKLHYANSAEPAIPAALSGVVTAIRGLHDFRLKPRAKAHYTSPATNSANGCAPATGGHQIVPDDTATMYDVKALYNQGINGSGQKVVIVGQSQIVLADIQKFRACFNLPASDPQLVLVPGLPDPGISPGDLGESELDIEIAGAVARGAQVIFVYSLNVDDAITYAINNNLGSVMSSSYGLCEAQTGSQFANSQRLLAQQANLLGITWVAASGDNGAADCFDPASRNAAMLAVDEPGSIPEVTSVGGTELTEASGNYWSTTNDTNLASALSWIPESAWNDSVIDTSPAASGGGASIFFNKPSWQNGPGVPADGARDVPDVSFASSADHDGYLIFTSDAPGGMQIFGGTSVAAPLFAGIVTLLNQYEAAHGFPAPVGPINPRLYAMATSVPNAFHDVTSGNNAVDPCPQRTRSCNSTPIGFNAGPGYDEATGLGSVDAFNLITAWHQTGVVTKATPTITLTSSAQTIPSTGSVVLTAIVSGSSGTAPTGTVTWYLNGTPLGTATLAVSGGTASAALTLSASKLSLGANSLSGVYAGDSTFTSTSGTQTITVTAPTLLTPTLTLSSGTPSVSRTGSVVLTAVVTGSGPTTPTGTVTWSAGATTLGRATLASSAGRATATLTVQGSALSVGSLTLSAGYSGDSNFSATNATLGLTVTSLTSSLTVSSSLQPIAQSGSVVLTSAVGGLGATTPTGTVTWSFAGTTLGSATLAGSAGRATATLTVQGSQLTVGVLSLSAAYSGDANYASATGLLALTVTASIPSVSGVVNAASSASATPQVVTPESYIAIYGSGLTTSAPIVNTTIPIPTLLKGTQTQVLLGGVPMPITYLSSGQINTLVPQSLTSGRSYPLTIVNGTTTTSIGSLTVAALQPGIFTYDTSGSGQGIAEIAGTTLLAGPTATGFTPAKRGIDYLQVYCTGLGPVIGPAGQAGPADGAAAPATTIYQTTAKVTATIGGISVPVPFAGLTGTFVSLYQVNIQIPANVPAGSSVPLVITATDPVTGIASQSNTVTIALQ